MSYNQTLIPSQQRLEENHFSQFLPQLVLFCGYSSWGYSSYLTQNDSFLAFLSVKVC